MSVVTSPHLSILHRNSGLSLPRLCRPIIKLRFDNWIYTSHPSQCSYVLVLHSTTANAIVIGFRRGTPLKKIDFLRPVT